MGEKIKSSGFFESIKNWFKDLFSGSGADDLGILQSTNDSILGANAQIDATESDAIQTESPNEEGFFGKISNWFKNLFGGNKSEDNSSQQNSDKETIIPENAETETHFEDKDSTENNSNVNAENSSEDVNTSTNNDSTDNTEIDNNSTNNN